MIHSIQFKDVHAEVEEAKRKAKESDIEYDREYKKWVAFKKRVEKEDAEYMEKRKKDPAKYPVWRMPSRCGVMGLRGEMDKRTKDTPFTDFMKGPYMNSLEALNGKRFEFSGGLNVIVGENGAGKTSLLKVIRKIFFAEGLNHSTLVGIPYWHLRLQEDTLSMMGICELKADYRRCAYNLLHDRDIDKHNPLDQGGIATFLQMYEGQSASKGEKGVIALNSLFREFDKKTNVPIESKHHPRGMEGNVMTVLKDALKHYNGESVDQIKRVIKYYKSHQVDDKKHPFIMDEPDSGFDVFKAKMLCDLLERMADDAEKNVIQPIVVLHNVAIISRLMKNKKVNFIELTPNYLETVRKFF